MNQSYFDKSNLTLVCLNVDLFKINFDLNKILSKLDYSLCGQTLDSIER